MVPLRAREGGVLARRGHTESAVGKSIVSQTSQVAHTEPDLCALTNLPQAGLLCELVNDDVCGTMARRDDCRAWSQKHGVKMISIEMIAQYKRQLEALQREREHISAS
jgi:3,4-dihydroxy-2-butanone 4-phosphate synthase